MAIDFEELDFQHTPLGDLILRRRRVLSIDQEVFEVKLDDAFLMSSLVNDSEIALADLVLDRFDRGGLDVVVGGLGLGHTAFAALEHHAVASVLVLEVLPQVIGWHERGLVPLAERLTSDPRCRFVEGDFFRQIEPSSSGLDPSQPGRQFDAILFDIDHTPRSMLDNDHGEFYEATGLACLNAHLREDGVFGLWSAEPPEVALMDVLRDVFVDCEAHEVGFRNPLMQVDDSNTIYVGRRR